MAAPPMTAGDADHPLEPFDAHSFPAAPELECDIVMKGGITSGVIYPLLVCELAQVYRLRSVGGTSAGAIAAAAAAAAEAGRATAAVAASGAASAATTGATTAMQAAATDAGFLGLARLPEELTAKQPNGKSRLFGLFRPRRSTKRLFNLLVAGLDGLAGLSASTKASARLRVAGTMVGGAVRAFPAHAALGGVLGVVLMWAGLTTLLRADSVVSLVASWLTLLIGLVLTAAGLALGAC